MENYIDVVGDLNDMLYDSLGETEHEFIYITNGQCHTIKFCDVMLWSSELEEREYIEEIDDYEPIKPYIIKIFKEQLNGLDSFKNIYT